ncbi:MAG: hypothetical protein ACM3W4_02050 [Ignavibacteriales bacterium]
MLILRVIASGEDPSGDEADDALTALNLMLKTWGVAGLMTLKAEASLPLVAGQQSYTVTARRLLSIRRRTSGVDYPMGEWTRQEYFDLPTKAATGTPTVWYSDPQRSVHTLYIWPTASAAVAANTTLEYTYQRVIEDIDDLDNEADLPQAWLEAIIYNLADRLMLQFGVDDQRITARAQALLADMQADSEPSASVFFRGAR